MALQRLLTVVRSFEYSACMSLQRVSPSVDRQSFPPVRIWRDDLEEIYQLIREVVSENDPINIRAHDGEDVYTLTSVGDIGGFNVPTLKAISIYAPTIKVTLRLGPKKSNMEAEEPDLRIRGLITEVARILSSKARPVGRVFAWIEDHVGMLAVALMAMGIAAVAIVAGEATNAEDMRFSTPALIGLVAGLFAGLITAWISVYLRLGSCILNVKTRLEAPTFWARKKDDIMITVVSSVLSLILGGIIGYWLNSIS